VLPTQLKLPNGASLGERALGIPAHQAQPDLQGNAFVELVNKLAWAIGTTYRVPYSNLRSPARQYAIALASEVQRRNGYPDHIAQPK